MSSDDSRPSRAVVESEKLGLSAGLRCGLFRLVRPIIVGGHSVVWEAVYCETGRKVALKFLRQDKQQNQEALHRVESEAHLTQRVNHSGVVQIHQLFEYDGYPVIAMQLLGKSLISFPKGKIRAAISAVCHLCDATAAIHGAEIVHRDLKPSNIMLMDQGEIENGSLDLSHLVIGDLGIAVALNDHRQIEEERGEVIGTPLYMAPEQLECGEPDKRTDVFGLGGLLFALLTGKPPNSAGRPFEALRNGYVPDTRELFKLPEALRDIIARAMDRYASARFRSALELKQALLEIEGQFQ